MLAADLARQPGVLRKDDSELLRLRETLRGTRRIVRAGDPNRPHSVYDPLREFLISAPEKSIQLPFRQIEEILRRPLPAAALSCEWWWKSDGVNTRKNVQYRAWQGAGRLTKVDLDWRTVEFTSRT
jgi:hypothetical protein